MVAQGEGTRLGYRRPLDGVRAVAIALVFIHHTAYHLVPSWRGEVMPAGFLGVDLFLALSGFLITTLLLERRGREPHPIARFWVRRALRLLPAVIVLLAVNVVAAVLFEKDVGDALRSIVVALTQTTNWAEVNGVGISAAIVHFWSLAIEGQFYLVWPLVLFGALRLGATRAQLIGFVLVAAVLAGAWRVRLWETGHGWLEIYLRTDARADALLIGVALAMLPYDRIVGSIAPHARALIGGAALLALVLAAQLVEPSSEVLYLGGFLVVAVLSTLVVATSLQPSPLAALLSLSAVVFLGRISYSLYLWHLPVFDVVAQNTESWPAAARLSVGWIVALGLATASYRYVEQPALRLKERLRPRTPARPAASVAPLGAPLTGAAERHTAGGS